ncbi:N-acetylmuramoyl-L-alanine amidase LytC precursor [Clostridium puniceum]|uniref:N-acetylmuramoyl-L-alanine amidase LytC n=1 Tax=Clostridium puniceum TaxID=29367 RepID=A0A1S8THF8_9CLOT|nr:N-acetylmuramoyl-L-alanine amidase LytC precursor [Clostridium puniceum]
MKTIKRLTRFMFVFAMVLLLIPEANAQASTTDNKIISQTEVTVKQAEQWAKSNGATDNFIRLAQLYWKYAKDHGNVNPAIAYVQAAKETGYGKFGGVLNDSYKNPCGMKTVVGGSDTDPNAHQKFDSWDEGVQAHLDHLALYADADGYPRSSTYDPRHFITIKGKAVTVNDLGGKWAPSLTYGEEVNKLYDNLMSSAGIISKTKTEAVDNKDKTSETPNSTTNKTTSSTGTNTVTKSEVDKTTTNTVNIPTGLQATEPIKNSVDNSTNISSSIGWKYEGGEWYYYKSDRSMATGWIKPDQNWYYLYSNGTMAKGWSKLGNNWYYLNSSGSMQIGWLRDSNKWYYLQGDGTMTTGLKLIDNKKYFLDASGAMRIGWFQISGQWYYFNPSGEMMTGWIKVNGNSYYLYSNGIMATGWTKLGDDWYWLKSSGDRMTGWVKYGNDTYYLDPITGIMAKDIIVNGWKIDKDGKRGEKVPGASTKVIVIDPGHNFGGDDGAYATNNGVTYSERDLNMQVAVKVKAKLEAQGYKVIMTRNSSDRETASVTESLTNRVNIANNARADLFVSIHHNSASAAASGVEVYYSSKVQDDSFGGSYSDLRLSASKNLATSLATTITNSTGAINRGAKDGNLFVCRNTTMPAVLIECGFITNPDEAQKCASSSYQDLEAGAIANAISSAV